MGMDIVKKNIEKLRGSLQIQSTLGTGTTIIIQVPLSVRVMHTLLLGTKENPILIPQLRIQEVRSISPIDISTIEDKRYYTLDDELLPCIPLFTLLGQPKENNTKLIICTRGSQRFGIEARHIHGFQEVVSHSVPTFLSQVHLYQGTSILEDGTPALILNLDHIFHSYELVGYEKIEHSVVNQKTTAYVVFQCSSLLAVPLSEILHVSKIIPSNLSKCSGWEVFHYGNDSYPIVEIADVISTKENPSYPHNFILLSSENSNVGIPVSTVVGIFHTEDQIKSTMKRKGIHGSIRYENQEVEVINIHVFHQSIIESNVSI
jgi:two-component system, chemotaxis family, sensor kinase CheA